MEIGSAWGRWAQCRQETLAGTRAKRVEEFLQREDGIAVAQENDRRGRLERRFGAVPPAPDERIAAADVDTLTALFDRALTVATIDAL